jgi:hypothetical protein
MVTSNKEHTLLVEKYRSITVPEQVYNQKGELEGVMHNEEADNA